MNISRLTEIVNALANKGHVYDLDNVTDDEVELAEALRRLINTCISDAAGERE